MMRRLPMVPSFCRLSRAMTNAILGVVFSTLILMVASVTLFAQPERETIFYEDFESGIGNWWVDNGLWEVGVPTVGPDSCHSGQNCAGTVLNGSYPTDANTKLVSPYIILPNISSGEHIKLKFWYWFQINEVIHGNDQGYVQISVEGGPWQNLAGPISGWSSTWTQGYVNLSAFADSTVRIAFYFISNWTHNDNGWYVDDISITVGAPIFNNPEDFELGTGDWSADNGLWEVGIPTVGPDSCHSGQNCVGTMLGGNYPTEANTRLISPYITLPSSLPGEHIKLKFWYWFQINEVVHGNDQGYVQISVNEGPWQTLAGPISGWSSTWTQGYVNLSAFADSTVRIAFFFISNWTHNDNGWYIDDISITVGEPVFNRLEDFELATGDWSADNGLWEVGIPTIGPDSCHSGQNCVGTMLGGNYPTEANTRLVSPQIKLIPEQGSFVELYYWHWFRINEVIHGNDQGYIQISVNGGPWQTLVGPISGYSTQWTQGYVDLSAYVDSTVRIAFYFTSNWTHNDNGWYIDDVRLVNVTNIEEGEKTRPYEYKLIQNYPNPFNSTTTIEFSLPRSCDVTLTIYNVLGQKVALLVSEKVSAGEHKVQWTTSDIAGGLYFCRLEAAEFTQTRKMVLLR